MADVAGNTTRTVSSIALSIGASLIKSICCTITLGIDTSDTAKHVAPSGLFRVVVEECVNGAEVRDVDTKGTEEATD